MEGQFNHTLPYQQKRRLTNRQKESNQDLFNKRQRKVQSS